jgi:hypothetical protein
MTHDIDLSDDELERIFTSNVVKTIEAYDVTDLAGEFVYNYFQRDESTNGSPTSSGIVSGRTITSIDLSTDAGKSSLSRYVILTWNPHFTIDDDEVLVHEFFEHTISLHHDDGEINYEDSEKSSMFSSINFQDKSSEGNYYNFYPSDDITRGTSVVTDAKISLNEKSQPIQGSDGTFTTDIFNKGINRVQSLNLSVIIGNEVLSSIKKQISEDSTSPFADDIANSGSVTDYIDRSIDTFTSTTSTPDGEKLIFSNAREIIWFKESYETVPSEDTDYHQHRVGIKGYIIEKRESDLDSIITDHPPIFIDGKDINLYIDAEVKYGSLYQYFVRTVYVSQFNMIEISEDDTTYKRYTAIIASKGSNKIDFLARDFEPPKPPENLQFRFFTGFDSLRIGWDYPINLQKDIKRVQIYRRDSINDPFSLLREYDFDDSSRKEYSPASGNESTVRIVDDTIIDSSTGEFIKIAPGFFYDVEFNENSKFIYALATIDAHGLTSMYSDQFEVSYDNLTNKVKTNFVSPHGAPKQYPNMKLKLDAFPDIITNINRKYMTVGPLNDSTTISTVGGATSSKVFVYDETKHTGEVPMGSYTIQAISSEQQQSNLFKFSIYDDS